MRRVWLLNFDADEELAGHQAPRAGATALQAKLTEAVRDLVGEDELFDPTVNYEGKVRGLAFMPTPRALAAFKRAGVVVSPAPPLDVLRRANSRALSAQHLAVDLPGATFAESEADVLSALARPSVTGTWLLKQALGFAGRGAKRVAPGAITDDVRAFVRKSLQLGGLEVAPWVTRIADFGLHGYLGEDGRHERGHATTQVCDRFGQWQGTRRTGDDELSGPHRAAFDAALTEAATALHGVGYVGPFGIDGFLYTLPDGTERFCPRCEINARYTMGWAIGMGATRPDHACSRR